MQRFHKRHRRQPSGDSGDAPAHDPFADRPGGRAGWPDRLSNVRVATTDNLRVMPTDKIALAKLRWANAPRAADNRRRIAGIERRKALEDREEAKRAPLVRVEADLFERGAVLAVLLWNRLHVAASINLRSRQTCERKSLSRHGLKCTPSCRVPRSRRGHCLIARRDARQRWLIHGR